MKTFGKKKSISHYVNDNSCIRDRMGDGPKLSNGGSRICSSRERQHTILLNFSKNCMKLKEFGPQGTVIVCPLVRLGLTMVKFSYSLVRHRGNGRVRGKVK